MFSEILSQPAVNFPISLTTYALVFLEALFLGLGISWVYRTKSISRDRSFQYVLWMTAPIVATLLLFIGSNLALSIGMVGSLSIIRFRTAIKDPADLMYLFILIMIGLGCGTQNFLITAVATAFMAIILFVIAGKNKSAAMKELLVLKSTKSEVVKNTIAQIQKVHPKAEVTMLSLTDHGAEATLVAQDISSSWLMELKTQTGIEKLHLIKE